MSRTSEREIAVTFNCAIALRVRECTLLCVSAFARAADAGATEITECTSHRLKKKHPQKVKRRKWPSKNCTLATQQGRTGRIFAILVPN